MIILKQGCNQKEKRTIENILSETVDLFGDFYCTKDNMRISIRDNSDLLFNYLKKGSQVIYDVNKENGMALILKEKGFRTYIKILTKDYFLACDFLKVINWHIKEDVYVKLHKNNLLIKAFQKNGYSFIGNRGMETLLMRKYISRPERPIKKYDKDE